VGSGENIADAAKLGQGPNVLIELRCLNDDERACMRESHNSLLMRRIPARSSIPCAVMNRLSWKSVIQALRASVDP
jgi:hypothetical protein